MSQINLNPVNQPRMRASRVVSEIRNFNVRYSSEYTTTTNLLIFWNMVALYFFNEVQVGLVVTWKGRGTLGLTRSYEPEWIYFCMIFAVPIAAAL